VLFNADVKLKFSLPKNFAYIYLNHRLFEHLIDLEQESGDSVLIIES
jgi:hypothetical protein